jgi:hypothetical protein
MPRPRLFAALAACAAVVVACVAAATPAGAGGWAVTTLDALPSHPVAGVPTEVGYTVRQHGVTPVALEGTAIVVEGRGAGSQHFDGRAEGPVGHYVATVTFPAVGALRWHVEQGWFAPQDLGTIDVAAGTGVPATLSPVASTAVSPTASSPVAPGGDDARWPSPVRWALLAASGLALVAFGAATASWRRQRHPGPAPLPA